MYLTNSLNPEPDPEERVWWDYIADTGFTISQMRRDQNFTITTWLHAIKSLLQAGKYPTFSEHYHMVDQFGPIDESGFQSIPIFGY